MAAGCGGGGIFGLLDQSFRRFWRAHEEVRAGSGGDRVEPTRAVLVKSGDHVSEGAGQAVYLVRCAEAEDLEQEGRALTLELVRHAPQDGWPVTFDVDLDQVRGTKGARRDQRIQLHDRH